MKKTITLLLIFYTIINFAQNTEKQNDSLIYALNGIEVKPEFPGGLEMLNLFINESILKAGFETQKNTKTKTSAKIVALFVVEKDGSLSDIKIYGEVDSLKSEELTRILQSLQKWNPGKQNRVIVRVHYTLPLT